MANDVLEVTLKVNLGNDSYIRKIMFTYSENFTKTALDQDIFLAMAAFLVTVSPLPI